MREDMEALIDRIEASAAHSRELWLAGVVLGNLGRTFASIAMHESGRARRERQLARGSKRETVDPIFVTTGVEWSL